VFSYFKNYATVPYQMFLNCKKLETISLTSAVTTLKEQAFYGCNKLSSFGDLSHLTRIESHALRNTLLDNLNCNNLNYLGEWAFRDNPNLTTAHIDGSITTLTSGSFYGCRQLTSVTGLSNITTINGDVFNGCISLTHIDNIDKIITINNSNAFRGCTSLTELETHSLRTIEVINSIRQ
jgi:hypothetical protein